MLRAPVPHLLALVCGFALSVLVAVGCGGDRSNLIPSQRASALVDQLDQIQSDIEGGRCEGLAAKVDAFHDDATSLTPPVDARLRRRINAGVRSLQANALDACRTAAAGTQTQTTDTQTTETQTETQTTETVPTTTTPPTTTTTPPTTTPTDTSGTPTTTTPPTDTGVAPPSGNGGTSGDGTLP